MTRWRQLRNTSLVFLAVILCGILIAIAYLNSEHGRVTALYQGLKWLPASDVRVELSDVHSASFGEWQIGKVGIYQQGRPWLDLHQLQLTWSPHALINKRLDIQQLTIARLDWHPQPATPKPQPEQPLRLVIPKIWPVKLDKLLIGEWHWLDVAKPAPVYQLQANGSLLWDNALLVVNLDGREINGQEPIVAIHTQTATGNQWQIKGQVKEPAGGFIGQTLKLPANQALDTHFELAIETLDEGYTLSLSSLQMPWRDRALAASGTFKLSTDFSTIGINQLQLKINQQSQVIRGQLTSAHLWLDMQLEQFPLELLQPWLPVNPGVASGQLDLSWPLNDPNHPLPDVTAQAQLRTRWQELPIDLQVEGDLRNKVAHFNQLELTLADSRLKAQGQWQLSGAETDFTYEIHNFHSHLLDQLALPFLQQDNNIIAQTLHRSQLLVSQGKGRFKGDWRNPEVTAAGSITGKFDDLSLALTIDGELNPRQAQFRQLDLTLPDNTISLKGKLDWSGGFNNFTTQFHNINKSLLERMGLLLPASLTFSLDGQAKISGALRQPQIKLDAQATGIYVSRQKDLPFTLVTKGDFAWGRGTFRQFDAEHISLAIQDRPVASVKGQYSPKRMALDLNVTELPADLLGALGAPQLKGKTSGDFHITGSFAQPNLAGKFIYQDTVKHTDGNIMALRWENELTTENRQLRLTSDFIENNNAFTHLQLTLPLDDYWQKNATSLKELPINLDVKGEGDLSLAKFFIDPYLYPMNGHMTLSLNARGYLDNPQINGQLELKDGQFEDRLLGTRLRNINLDIRALGQEIKIENGKASDGDNGKAQLTGHINWQNPMAPEAAQFALNFNDFHLMERHDIITDGRGKVELKGNIDTLKLTGEVNLTPLNLSIESTVSRSIPKIKVTEYSSRETLQITSNKAKWPTLDLDLWIKANNPAYIRGRGLEAELEGGILLQGPINQLRYSGALSSPRGKLDIFGKRFTLQRGEINFDQGALNIYIPAYYNKDDLEIKAELSGNLDDLKLVLSSVPALPQDEILARLIFGKQVQAITPFEAIRLAAAVQSLGSGGGFSMMDSARSFLGVDTLNVGMENTADGQTGLNIGVGKYVSEKVYLEVQRSPNPSSPWQGDVQIELTPSINLESSTGENGRGKAQLLWRRDY